jgi:sterol desaturase/sphingolipid hydroxylase (fatty acid hydroxylase superfamily)
VIESTLEILRGEVAELAPLVVLFGVLAYVTKRRAILAAVRRARGEISTTVILLLINAVIFGPLLFLPVMIGQTELPRPQVLLDVWTALPGAVSVVAAVLLTEFAAYWRHRLEHVRALWPVHATHHADEAMTWLSVRRKHPLGELLSVLIDTTPVILLGLPVWAIAVAMLIRGWWGYFIHADVPWTLGPFGKLFISPAAHRLHHIRDEALMGTNYGNMLTVWDKLFGTYLDPAPYVNCETGIAEGTRDAWGELARPFEARYWRGSAEEGGEQPAA